ncbi:phosphate:Na+ symporter [Ancylobacter sp. 3268]|uniref:Na+/Picotransporter n=1 Tax=Ancylobacter sp. 3268 TaxID=2817752 RepID=UPI0028647AC3|nr:Na+/Picotransporter [Ancylobacter sp. 3268]MDR6953038.1 phosphate:Na+ symporter [Ancylobacter sp. 3268]
MATLALLLSGLGLFFIGVRALSANLVPLVGRRGRAAFSHALRGPISSAVSGTLAGIVTQSSTAVSWIIVSFIRGGVLPPGPALGAPNWANVGTALLPLIVAIDTSTAAGVVIGIAGFVTYFKLARGERMRHVVEAALGAALLLFGMHLVAVAVGPVRDSLMHNPWWEVALQHPLLLALIGFGFSLAAQSSSVAAAIAVAAVGGGLLDLSSALPLVAGANAAGMVNNAVMVPGETMAGRLIFAIQVVQKGAGSLLLALVCVAAALFPQALAGVLPADGDPRAQIAVLFLLAQIGGAFIASLTQPMTRRLMERHLPASPAETLAQPAFLLRESLSDPAAALDLAVRELARLAERLPMMLDKVREEPDATTPAPAMLRVAGVTLAGSVKAYLAALLDGQMSRRQIAVALLLDDAAANVGALHDALGEFAEVAGPAQALPTARRLIESLHALLGAVAEHGESLGAEDPEMVLSLLGHRDQVMEALRQRLSSQNAVTPMQQDALFRMTILFERIVWLARQLVNSLTQAHRA